MQGPKITLLSQFLGSCYEEWTHHFNTFFVKKCIKNKIWWTGLQCNVISFSKAGIMEIKGKMCSLNLPTIPNDSMGVQ